MLHCSWVRSIQHTGFEWEHDGREKVMIVHVESTVSGWHIRGWWSKEDARTIRMGSGRACTALIKRVGGLRWQYAHTIHRPIHRPIHQPSTNHPPTIHRLLLHHACDASTWSNHSPKLYFDLDSNPGKVGFGEGVTFGPIRTSASTQYRRSINSALRLVTSHWKPSCPLTRTFSLLKSGKGNQQSKQPGHLGPLQPNLRGILALVASSWPAKSSPLRLHTTSGYPKAPHHPTIGESFRKKIKSEQMDLTD